MTISDRVAAYRRAFPEWEASWPVVVREQDREVLYATWVLGNDYRRRSDFYGAYPPNYLKRMAALFPGIQGPSSVLHAFSGSLPAGNYSRCDLQHDAELQCRVEDLPQHQSFRTYGPWELAYADPPYSAADAARYGTPMVNRRIVLAALAAVVRVGGFLVWLDCVWPMHRKDAWTTVGRVTIVRSTNHRIRMATIFERVG